MTEISTSTRRFVRQAKPDLLEVSVDKYQVIPFNSSVPCPRLRGHANCGDLGGTSLLANFTSSLHRPHNPPANRPSASFAHTVMGYRNRAHASEGMAPKVAHPAAFKQAVGGKQDCLARTDLFSERWMGAQPAPCFDVIVRGASCSISARVFAVGGSVLR